LLGRWREKSLWLGPAALVLAAAGGLAACAARQPSVAPPPPRPAFVVPAPPSFVIPRFAWPVNSGTLSSGFGVRHGAMHEGVDIAAPVGTPVLAAAGGRVVFVGRLRGYGNIVIIQHEYQYVTVYAHDSLNVVKTGQLVERGQLIGLVGRTGHTSGANLHFEVRHKSIASNPLTYLPPFPFRDSRQTRLAAGVAY